VTRIIRTAVTWRPRFRERGGFPIKAGGPITALDWNGTTLRIAQSVLRGSKPEISSFASVPLDSPISVGTGDPAACGQRLAHALADLKPRPGVTVMGIPRSLVFLRTLLLPKPRNEEELVAMVHFQISKDLPFPVEDAVVDFQVNESLSAPGAATPTEKSEEEPAGEKVAVLVAVVRREVVQFYERLASAAGLKLAALGLSAYANARGLEIGGLTGKDRVVAMVSLSAGEVITEVVVGGALVFSRTAAMAPEVPETQTGTGSLDEITIEVVRSLHSFAGLARQNAVEEILLAGDHPQAASVVEALSERCQIPCRQIDPFQSLKVAARLHPARSASGLPDPGAFTVLSQALIAQDQVSWPFDFLHPKRPAIPRNLKRIRILSGAAAAGVLFMILWGIRTHLVNQRITVRDQVAAEIEAVSKSRPLFRKIRLNAKTVQDWSLEKREWLDHLAHLSAVLPGCSDVYITSISTGARGALHISIQARSGDILADIDKRLRAAGYDLKPLAVTPGSDRYGYPFQSSLELTLPDKMKIDLASLKVPARPEDDGSQELGQPGQPRSVSAQVSSEGDQGGNDAERRSRRRDRQ